MFKHGKRVLALAAEINPGVAVVPGATSADWQGREVDWPRTNVDFEEDKVANGDHGENEAVSGIQDVEFTAKWALKGSTAVNVAPDWSFVAEAHGLKRTAHGSTGQSWVMHTDNEVKTLTGYGLMMEAGAAPQQLAIQARGIMGSSKLVCEGRGKPVKFHSSMKGCWLPPDADVVTGSRFLINAPTPQTPEKFLSNSVTIHGVSYRTDSFEMDWGAVVAPVPDQSQGAGNIHFYIKEWKPRLKMAIEVPRASVDNWKTKLTAMTVGPVVINIGTQWKLTVPRAQAIARSHKDLEGVEYMDITFACLRNGTADATMDVQAQAEILYGAKS